MLRGGGTNLILYCGRNSLTIMLWHQWIFHKAWQVFRHLGCGDTSTMCLSLVLMTVAVWLLIIITNKVKGLATRSRD